MRGMRVGHAHPAPGTNLGNGIKGALNLGFDGAEDAVEGEGVDGR